MGILFGCYLIQVIACGIRVTTPHRVTELPPFRVEERYGPRDGVIFVPVLGWTVFSGDGNRVLVERDGVVVEEISIDLFMDFDAGELRVEDGKLWLPDPGPGGGYWVE